MKLHLKPKLYWPRARWWYGPGGIVGPTFVIKHALAVDGGYTAH